MPPDLGIPDVGLDRPQLPAHQGRRPQIERHDLLDRAIVDQPLIARAAADAPDIDGRILLSKPAPVGGFIDVKITGTQVYDLTGDPLV